MDDELQDRYIEIVAHNFTPHQYEMYARLIRAHWYARIWATSGRQRDGLIFTKLWGENFSIAEEAELAGFAILVEHGLGNR